MAIGFVDANSTTTQGEAVESQDSIQTQISKLDAAWKDFNENGGTTLKDNEKNKKNHLILWQAADEANKLLNNKANEGQIKNLKGKEAILAQKVNHMLSYLTTAETFTRCNTSEEANKLHNQVLNGMLIEGAEKSSPCYPLFTELRHIEEFAKKLNWSIKYNFKLDRNNSNEIFKSLREERQDAAKQKSYQQEFNINGDKASRERERYYEMMLGALDDQLVSSIHLFDEFGEAPENKNDSNPEDLLKKFCPNKCQPHFKSENWDKGQLTKPRMHKTIKRLQERLETTLPENKAEFNLNNYTKGINDINQMLKGFTEIEELDLSKEEDRAKFEAKYYEMAIDHGALIMLTDSYRKKYLNTNNNQLTFKTDFTEAEMKSAISEAKTEATSNLENLLTDLKDTLEKNDEANDYELRRQQSQKDNQRYLSEDATREESLEYQRENDPTLFTNPQTGLDNHLQGVTNKLMLSHPRAVSTYLLKYPEDSKHICTFLHHLKSDSEADINGVQLLGGVLSGEEAGGDLGRLKLIAGKLNAGSDAGADVATKLERIMATSPPIIAPLYGLAAQVISALPETTPEAQTDQQQQQQQQPPTETADTSTPATDSEQEEPTPTTDEESSGSAETTDTQETQEEEFKLESLFTTKLHPIKDQTGMYSCRVHIDSEKLKAAAAADDINDETIKQFINLLNNVESEITDPVKLFDILKDKNTGDDSLDTLKLTWQGGVKLEDDSSDYNGDFSDTEGSLRDYSSCDDNQFHCEVGSFPELKYSKVPVLTIKKDDQEVKIELPKCEVPKLYLGDEAIMPVAPLKKPVRRIRPRPRPRPSIMQGRMYL